MTRLRYPVDLGDELKSKISFQVVQVQPPSFRAVDTSATIGQVSVGEAGRGGDQGSRTPTLETVENMKVNFTGTKIDIHTPISFQVNDGLEYSTPSLGARGMVAQQALSNGGSIAGALAEGVVESGKSMIDAIKGISVGNVTEAGIARILSATGTGGGLSAAASNVSRIQVNPNIRTLFTGVRIREFNFTFKMIPVSREESDAIQQIIRAFRVNAYPEKIEAGGVPLGYKYPNLFKIRLLSGVRGKYENVGTPLKLCYLRSISTAYNATSTVLHEDGSPTEVDLTLNFTEYKPLTREDVVNERNPQFYHYEGRAVGSAAAEREADI